VVELDQILARLADGARQSLQADAAAVRLLAEEDKREVGGARLTVAGAAGPLDREASAALEQQEPIAVADSPLDKEALSGQPVFVADARADPRAATISNDYRSVLCVPLMHEGVPLGTLHVYAMAPGCFCEEHTVRLMPLAEIGSAAVAAARTATALKAQEASKAHFIHVATHELRSPVAVAQSLVRGVLKGYAGHMTDQQADIFGRVSRRLDFLESLVNDLLDLAAGKATDPAEQAVVLNSSVGRSVLSLQPRAEEKGVTLIHQACCEELVVWGTEDGLDRIFVNLVENAIKYTPPGGNVTAAMQRLENAVEVQVVDDGIGIPEESLPHLFQEFYRAPNAKASHEVGTGLGLAIVKDLVDRYGGCIEVKSAVGQGTTFTVTFPLFQFRDDEGGTCSSPVDLGRSS
jgi:K+-sensing histidine kinase KdpD